MKRTKNIQIANTRFKSFIHIIYQHKVCVSNQRNNLVTNVNSVCSFWICPGVKCPACSVATSEYAVQNLSVKPADFLLFVRAYKLRDGPTGREQSDWWV